MFYATLFQQVELGVNGDGINYQKWIAGLNQVTVFNQYLADLATGRMLNNLVVASTVNPAAVISPYFLYCS